MFSAGSETRSRHRDRRRDPAARQPDKGLEHRRFGAAGFGDQIEQAVAFQRQLQPGAADDLARHRHRIAHAADEGDERLRLDRLVGEALFDEGLHLGRGPAGDRDAAGIRHGDRAVLADELRWDRDAGRSGGGLPAFGAAEQPAGCGLPDRHRNGIADADLRIGGPAVLLEPRGQALARLAQQGGDDVVVDIDDVEACAVVCDRLAEQFVHGRPRGRQRRASGQETSEHGGKRPGAATVHPKVCTPV